METNVDRELTLKVSGNSMYPALSDGDLISIKRFGEYQVNDIVVINCNDHLVIHRVIHHKSMHNTIYYLTKGDNNNFIDRWFPCKSIVGKVTKRNGYAI